MLGASGGGLPTRKTHAGGIREVTVFRFGACLAIAPLRFPRGLIGRGGHGGFREMLETPLLFARRTQSASSTASWPSPC